MSPVLNHFVVQASVQESSFRVPGRGQRECDQTIELFLLSKFTLRQASQLTPSCRDIFREKIVTPFLKLCTVSGPTLARHVNLCDPDTAVSLSTTGAAVSRPERWTGREDGGDGPDDQEARRRTQFRTGKVTRPS